MRFPIVLIALVGVAAAGFLAGSAACRRGQAETPECRTASPEHPLSAAVAAFVRSRLASGQAVPSEVTERDLITSQFLSQEDISILEKLDLRVSIPAGERAQQQTNPAGRSTNIIHNSPMQRSLNSHTRFLANTAVSAALATLIHSDALATSAPVPDGAKANRWTPIVQTSDIKDAGTDADVYLGLTWQGGGTFITMPDLPGDENERNDPWTVYNITLQTSVPVHHVGAQLSHSNTGEKAGWHVGKVMLIAWLDGTDQRAVLLDASLNRWLAADEKDGLAAALPVKKPRVLLGQVDRTIPVDKFNANTTSASLEFRKPAKVEARQWSARYSTDSAFQTYILAIGGVVTCQLAAPPMGGLP